MPHVCIINGLRYAKFWFDQLTYSLNNLKCRNSWLLPTYFVIKPHCLGGGINIVAGRITIENLLRFAYGMRFKEEMNLSEHHIPIIDRWKIQLSKFDAREEDQISGAQKKLRNSSFD